MRQHFQRLKLLFIGAASLSAAVAATPPASLGGKTLHTYEVQVSVRTSLESTVRLNGDGTFDYIYFAKGDALYMPTSYSLFVTKPGAGGTFTYSLINDTTAELILTNQGNPGSTRRYTMNFVSPTFGSLIEWPTDESSFYLTDSDEWTKVPVVNLSLRGQVIAGHPLIAGFIVPGTQPRQFIIRVAGPALTQFGVGQVWTDPDFELHGQQSQPLAREVHYSNWSENPYYDAKSDPNNVYSPLAGFQSLFQALGLFPFSPGSKDAVEVVWLTPGGYTIVCSPKAGDSGGEALIEVYSMP